jgi:hypothetical protein
VSAQVLAPRGSNAVWAKYFSNGFNGAEAGEYEAKQSRDAISQAVKAGVKHIVYSTLGHTGYVPHMDKKAEGER